jgi:hypothetical protein
MHIDFDITFLKVATKWLKFTNDVLDLKMRFKIDIVLFKNFRKMGWILKEFWKKTVECCQL